MQRLLRTFVSAVLISSVAFAGEHPPLEVHTDSSLIAPTAEIPLVSYADVLDRATPSVVAVYTSQLVTVGGMNGRISPQLEELFRQFGMPLPQNGRNWSQPHERLEPLGVGSGVIISEDGYIITNRHVVTGSHGEAVDEIRVRLPDDREFVAELIGADAKTDVAVLRVQTGEPLPAITVANSDQLRVGDVVFAIGNPMEIGLTATKGIVSATGRQLEGRILGPGSYENFIQTDAAINLGNSGGALIDAWGRLIGINTAIVSQSGGSIGIGFAIPSSMALSVAENLIKSGEVPRGLLGLFPESLDQDMADAFGLDSTKGALVNQVQEGSPAERGGIRHGDIIIKIDDIEIESAQQLRLVVSQMMPGRDVQVTLIRGGQELVLPVVLGSLTGSMPQVETPAPAATGMLKGVSMQALTDSYREKLSLPDGLTGVLVDLVDANSPYADELARGMVILEVNGTAVTDAEAVAANLQEGVNTLYVWYGGKKRFVIIRLTDED